MCRYNKERSEIYYAYEFVYRAMDQPFRSSLPSTLLNIGRAVQFDPIKPELKPRLVSALETEMW